MTHESKLALIIGFALLLLVGVVVSDHVAPHSREAPADVADERTQAPAPLPGLGGGEPEQVAISRVQPRTVQPSSVQPERRGSQVPALAAGPLIHIDQGAGEIRTQSTERPFRPPLMAATGEGWREPVPTRRMTPRPTAEQVDDALWHVVTENETLWQIAELHLGDGNLHSLIVRANPTLIRDDVIVPGQRLKIPARAASTAGADRPGARAQSRPTGRRGSAASQPRSYVVQPGDTLSEIASSELGSVRHMDAILKANSDTLESADEIRVGMTLTLPEV